MFINSSAHFPLGFLSGEKFLKPLYISYSYTYLMS